MTLVIIGYLRDRAARGLAAVGRNQLTDACNVHLYRTGFDIAYDGETLYKGWREWTSRL